MPDIRPGDTIDVTIKGVRVDSIHPAGPVVIWADDDVWAMPPQAAIERVAPAEWPPEVNDLWRDREGVLWFAMENRLGDVLLTDRSGGRHGPDYVSGQHGPLTLVHREDQAEVSES